jgi:hypothetical protein
MCLFVNPDGFTLVSYFRNIWLAVVGNDITRVLWPVVEVETHTRNRDAIVACAGVKKLGGQKI